MVESGGIRSGRPYVIEDYRPREIAGALSRLLGLMPVVVLTGMRQVGKSTLLVNEPLLSDRDYFTLDNPVTQAALRESPDTELAAFDRLTIDEAQREEGLFLAIRRALASRETPGRFLVSGSASLPLRKGTAETLAGKAVYRRMLPMTRREISGRTEREPFLLDFIRKPRRVKNRDVVPLTNDEVLRGGMPRVALSSAEVGEVWLEGYEQTYLERDILYLSRIENMVGFKIMLRLLAARSGQILNLNQVARDAELPHNTAKHYLGLLEELFVVQRIQPYTRSLRSGIRKSPKLFVSDSGIACSLAGCRDLSEHPLRGFMYETYVFQNLTAILEAHSSGWGIGYWRVDETREVDLVLDTREQVVGIEIKAGEIPQKKDIRSLRAFMEATPECDLCILGYNGVDIATLGEGIWALPLDLLLQ
ncbi:MAG: ATP-binding protein [Actinomycetota bacterium]